MRKLARSLAAVAALGLFAGTAHAGEVVFTDEGWYRVEGSEATPAPDQTPDALVVEPARPAPPASPALAPSAAPIFAPEPGGAPPCLEERGMLVRRVLALHGLSVSRIDADDVTLGAVGWGAPLPYSASLSLDPDLNLLAGNSPVAPSSANWDEEVLADWQALLSCQTGR